MASAVVHYDQAFPAAELKADVFQDGCFLKSFLSSSSERSDSTPVSRERCLTLRIGWSEVFTRLPL